MNRKSGFIAVIIFFIYVLICYLFPKFFLTLELRIYDNFLVSAKNLNYYPSHLNDITIVVFDDISFQKMNKKRPLSRAIYADLLNKIESAQPKLIVFDVVFGGEGLDKEGDELLAKELKGKNNILLPYHIGEFGERIKSKEEFVAECGLSGFINKPIDIDGSIRRLSLFSLTIERKILDYVVELYLFSRYYNYNINKIVLKDRFVFLDELKVKEQDKFKRFGFPLLSDYSIWINYQANMKDFNVIPMWHIISNKFNPAMLKDKVVIFGDTSKIFHDIYDTPLGLMPGVGIMANAALMFLDGRFIYEVPGWLNWLLLLGFCLLIVFSCYRFSILKGLSFTILVVAIVGVVAFLLFLNNYYYNPFRLILICVVSYIIINFYKYASVVIENMRLRKLSTIDALTGLYTYRYFNIVLNHEFQKYLRYKLNLSLLMMDIDDFKKINDTYGHQKGNIVLNKIGKIILKNVRHADFPARFGGEEIAILLSMSNAEGAKMCAENLRRLIEKENFFMTSQGPLNVTVSIGVASVTASEVTSADEMIRFADTALYSAKREGKNRTKIYIKET